MWPSFFGQIMHLHVHCTLQSRLVFKMLIMWEEATYQHPLKRKKFCLCRANTSLVSSATTARKVKPGHSNNNNASNAQVVHMYQR